MDKNATTIAMEQAEKTMRENMLQFRITDFVKDFAPKDQDENAEFHYRLIDIVRQIYDDASARPHAQMMKLIEAMPLVIPTGMTALKK